MAHLNRQDLQEYRWRQRLSLRDIAWAAEPKWSPMFVSYLERGMRPLTPERCQRYVDAIHRAVEMRENGTWDEPKIIQGKYVED